MGAEGYTHEQWDNNSGLADEIAIFYLPNPLPLTNKNVTPQSSHSTPGL